jgi:hypothetical protein
MSGTWTIPGGTQAYGHAVQSLRGYSSEAETALERAGVDPGAWGGVFVATRWVRGERRDRDGRTVARADHTAVRTDVTPVAMHEGVPAFVAFLEAVGRVLGELPGAYEVGVHQDSRGDQRGYRPHAYVVRRLPDAAEPRTNRCHRRPLPDQAGEELRT